MVVGHDPRLSESDTIARYAFFADLYLSPISSKPSERAKYKLAESVFSYLGHITSFRYRLSDYVLTNLCNEALPRPPKDKVVLIPRNAAERGIEDLRAIIKDSQIETIFAMSQQVNFWLQELGSCQAIDEFLEAAEPTQRGIDHDPPFYEPSGDRAFQLICGNRLECEGIPLYPILHVTQWPLKGNVEKAYAKCYESLVSEFK